MNTKHMVKSVGSLSRRQLQYICRYMLGLGEWVPWDDFWGMDDKVLRVLELCQSKLEIMYLLGAYYRLLEIASDEALGVGPLMSTIIKFNGVCYPAIWFIEPYYGWCTSYSNNCCGPSAMAFVPQIEIGGRHFDFGIFYGDDNGSPVWELEYIVEIDGYAVHRQRRNMDYNRDKILAQRGITVIRLLEETDNPLTWFENKIVRPELEKWNEFFKEIATIDKTEDDDVEF